MMARARSFLSTCGREDIPIPLEAPGVTDMRHNKRATRLKAIEEHLGVFPDGSEVPLTTRQRILFRNPISKLTYKIGKAHQRGKEIVRVVTSYRPWEDDDKNTQLIRCFIIECLSPFKRKTLEATNMLYDDCPADRSSWPVYIAAWIFISGTLIFFAYWIFAWGIYQEEETLKAWGEAFGTVITTDVCLVQVTKVFILFYLPSQAMQSQLVRIRKILSDITINRYNTNDERIVDEISVVQHMSAACRAARSQELKELPSAWLLRLVRNDQTNYVLLNPLTAPVFGC